MKRFALAGLFVGLVAGSVVAQDAAPYPGGQSAQPSSSRVILKGVSASNSVVPAAATAMLTRSETAQEPKAETKELAKCGKCGHEWTDCRCNGCGWTLMGEWLFLQPRGADAVYAARALNCFSPPIAGSDQIDFGNFSGFKVGFAKALCDPCTSIGASWTHFEAEEEDRATPTTGTDVILPLLFHPLLLNCPNGSSTRAHASAGIDFDRVNLDYRRNIGYGCWKFDWLVGFAYGQLLQDLRAVYDEGFVRVDSNLWGYGAHLGAGAEYGVGCLRGFGHIDLTLLASNAKASYVEVDQFDGQEVNYSQDLDRIIPVLDLELGVAWDICKNTTLKFGYLYSFWFNVVTTPSFVEDVQHGDITGNSGDTLTFDGIFARLEVSW